MRRYVVLGTLAWAGCADAVASDDFAFPPVAPSMGMDSTRCEPTLDTPTPLGLTGADLLALYGGEFDLELAEHSPVGGPTVIEPVHVVISHRTGGDVEDAARCGAVAVPVRVSIRGSRLDLNEPGTLSGTPLLGHITFGTERVSAGQVFAQQGLRMLEMIVQDARWTSEGVP